jgi:DNA polymerase I-like protein with 3'-5' exonuclease and polymerase domains
LVPPEALAADYPVVREACKRSNLGTNYGLSAHGLAVRLQIIPAAARELLLRHREIYRRFWHWIEQTIDSAMLNNRIDASFGWPLIVTAETKSRTLQNFPMQGNGAEMMRLAAIAATESGLEICGPVHDAFLLCAPVERIDEDVALLREIMRRASLAVTRGLEVRTDAKIIRYPDRYSDERGVAMWRHILRLRENLDRVTL